MRCGLTGLAVLVLSICGLKVRAADPPFGQFAARVVDQDTGQMLPCRVYLKGADGKYYFPEAAGAGSVVIYDKAGDEQHATVSAVPFRARLPIGEATVTVERGKEYIPLSRRIMIEEGREAEEVFKLKRYINMARRGWYSGDTHVHRKPSELPNIMLAEDLNVSFPLIAWARDAYRKPQDYTDPAFSPNRPGNLFEIDDTHVICGMNTEYEIFSVDGKQWTLGAFMILNHRKTFEVGVPPVAAVSTASHAQGALLDLDKHNWPWSMMLVPVAKIDLYELSNNHMWRIHPRFITWGEPAPDFMSITPDPEGWAMYGFKMYYALLNCGFRLKPSAGTASGVHPVPLGHSRVYAKVDGKFSFEKWMKSLAEGRSFVTTGPMLFLTVNGSEPGSELHFPSSGNQKVGIKVDVHYARPVRSVEVLVNGEVEKAFALDTDLPADEGHHASFEFDFMPERSCWVAARCFEKEIPGNVSFAHTGPVYVMLGDRPITPRKHEVRYLLERVKEELDRNRGVLSPEALAEYEEATSVYRGIEATAR
jgi:hypothetical protein